MSKKTIIAPVGDYIEDIFVSIREFPTERVILLAPKDKLDVANETKESLDKFKVPTRIVEIEGNIWEAIFKEVAKLKQFDPGDLMINVSTGDRESRCAATSAAFVNGLKAFAVQGDALMMLPVLKFSYYKDIGEKKMSLLKIMHDKSCCASLDELSKRSGMSLPLISYHINGNLKSEGLKTMGLVDTEEVKGKVKISLSTPGRMLLKGYIKSEEK
ncbi:winged helix-turn-helix transcriptional regulator [Candidatus Woesearchaeota archaeon]|jgi:hypothetical protein|nr:winged helix-turn-helix transcriptional regulator [Candidatus Woesearchaeota archaeon]MBT3538002.1 winged helix-turn-helix transcriptional regulator [Candidatus Woesearchaeota archaeon]MBT4697356.1 winged helix-turn-helix transcriptional regulator [Candidatus Woesearchaeota archaeon]MBT4717077.1 winged helix-turn-helix transcriptional regulator [Candidatus Woesearchaeota archaeon]MBT7105671.1 winged helix-turn-helix transcriptional regulator [Candidatus Woesearchaeota archaeon]